VDRRTPRSRPCSRQILKRVTADAARSGIHLHLGHRDRVLSCSPKTDKPAPASGRQPRQACYDLRTMLHTTRWSNEIVSAMERTRWDVYSFDHEAATGIPKPISTYRTVVSMFVTVGVLPVMVGEIARKHGLFAIVECQNHRRSHRQRRPSTTCRWADESGANLFAAADDPRECGLTTLGYQFIAGVLRHAHAICAVIAPTVNTQTAGQAGQACPASRGLGVRLLRRQRPHEHASHPKGGGRD